MVFCSQSRCHCRVFRRRLLLSFLSPNLGCLWASRVMSDVMDWYHHPTKLKQQHKNPNRVSYGVQHRVFLLSIEGKTLSFQPFSSALSLFLVPCPTPPRMQRWNRTRAEGKTTRRSGTMLFTSTRQRWMPPMSKHSNAKAGSVWKDTKGVV